MEQASEIIENTAEILQNPTEILTVEPSQIDAALQSLIQMSVHFCIQLLVAVLIFAGGFWRHSVDQFPISHRDLLAVNHLVLYVFARKVF